MILNSFESRLQSAVMRLSRQDDHYGQVQEVIQHFHDLVEENRVTGMPEQAARKSAERAFGNPVNIARDIVTTPQQIRVGKKLQWIGVVLWLVSLVLIEMAPIPVRLTLRRIFVPIPWLPTDPFFVSSIFLVAIGAFRARTVNRPALVSCLAGFTVLCVGILGLRWFNISSRVSQENVEAERRIEMQRKPQYEAFEQALKVCISESGNQNPDSWKHLGEVLRQVNLPWVQTYPGQHGQWVALWNFPDQDQTDYRFDFTTIQNLDDAKLMWKMARPLEPRLAGIIRARETNIQGFSAPQETIAATVARIVVLQTLRFAFIFLIAAGLVRSYFYRRDLMCRTIH